MIPSFLTRSSDFAIFVLCIFNVQTTSNDFIYIYFIYTYISKSPLKKIKKISQDSSKDFDRKYPRLGAGSGEWVSDPSVAIGGRFSRQQFF